MKKSKIIFLFVLYFIVVTTKAQSDSSFQFIKTIKGNFTNFSVDNLENIYLLTTAGQLKKINSTGDSLAVFNDVKRFGSVSSIDVTNPLKILLYYKNFATIVVLDRFLNSVNTINLRKQNIFSVNTIATSYDNNFWLFDEQDYKLKKIAANGSLLLETTDFRMLFDTVPSAVQLTDRNNFIYLYDTAKGFFIFDYYGSFKNRLAFLNWHNIAISEKNIYGFSNNKLYSYQLNSLTLKEYPLSSLWGNYTILKAINGKVYVLKNNGVFIYQVK